MRKTYFILAVLGVWAMLFAGSNKDNALFSDSTFSGLKLRSIGPALMSGRIADIAIHPNDFSTWYVAVGSGGVWKTENSGTTWKPVFDKQSSYSIGCVTIDPANPHTIWVGTGENVGGRHVGFGDGVYRSDDDGLNWQNMGLKNSQHISKIVIHPQNSNIIWVASQGPLWSKGGERGIFKSVNGGKNWKQVLGDKKWVGATDICLDPRNPDRLYAATWQRERNIAAYMGGGPGTAIYRSDDGGERWEKLTKGLPEANMGKIGLAVSPQNPDVIYAAIELERRTGAVYRSENRGSSWNKMSTTVSGATGPHYYQELYASPHQFDRLYLVDVRMRISEDGGKTFRTMKEEFKHSDNHAIAFRPDDPDYLLVGTDGGIYESFDLAQNWRFIDNLPVTQFYKVAVDDAEPFFNIYGGTQDNNTQGGPSRTDNVHGIRNADWYTTLFGDGHQPATEPGNPNIIYSEWQEGNLYRIDRSTGETVYIKPQPAEGESYERNNWDSPILVSPHSPTRIFHASQRVWQSDDRGDSWTAISGDLTRHQERFDLPIMDQAWSWDSPWDVLAMSNYNTITSLAESPKKEGLIYAGTDDGLIQVTENGGKNWRKIEVKELPDVPKTAFVNDIKADLFDANTVYIALDNHKYGDFSPYLLKSTDRGNSWESIRGNIPERTLVWRVVQDHIKSDLLFAATEFGIYFTIDGGDRWAKLSGGVPTISFRDLAIQRRENDLVCASFGRGFYVFDDYSILRDISDQQLKEEASLFPVRKAWWYIQRRVLGGSEKASQGAGYFSAPNPPFGAVFTYYLSDDILSAKELRQKKESELKKKNKNVTFPGWKEVEEEDRQEEPLIWLTVSDSEGNVVRRLSAPAKKGFHRIAWDLHYPLLTAIKAKKNENRDDENTPQGILAAPEKYNVQLSKQVNGMVSNLSRPVSFDVVPMLKGSLPAAAPDVVVAFWKKAAALQKDLSAAALNVKTGLKKVEMMKTALIRSTSSPGELDKRLLEIREKLLNMDEALHGSKAKNQVGEKFNPTIGERLSFAMHGSTLSTYGPTPPQKESLQIAQKRFSLFDQSLKKVLNEEIPALLEEMQKSGAPKIEGEN